MDARWNMYEGGDGHVDQREDAWNWQPRLRGLVENEVYPTFAEMLAWKDWSEMNARAHMMAWSRVGWLLQRKQSSPGVFLMGVSEPAPEGEWQVPYELLMQRQDTAFAAAFELSPAEALDEWCSYVKKSYPRK